ncbi:extracellular solute-binding protein [Aminobacter sp. MSH1]|uniref:extracellular solute-binding protein n=1 Tax=Aminobacter sp. MSH1 TaxID=374606 RepID=UPI000D38BC29|nr:extracellular solute-binding protein [Aminobacter sp. MSH1]
MKPRLLAATLLAAAALTGPAAAFDWRQAEGTEITLLASEHPWTAGVREHLPEFEALTGIKVNVTAFAEDLYVDRANLAIRSDKPVADVFMSLMDAAIFEQWNVGGVASLTPFLKDATLTDAAYDYADFSQALLQGASFPPGDAAAEQFALPISMEAYILFYNKALVDKHLGGKVPASWDELLAGAQKVTEAGGGQAFGSVMRGQRSGSLVDTMTGIVLNAWGEAEAPLPYNIWFDGAWDKPRFDDPRIATGLAHYAGLLKAGPENALSFGWEDASRYFAQDKAAFFIDASVFGPGFEDPKTSPVGGHVGYAVLPPTDGVSVSGHWAWGLSMAKNSEKKNAAWLFMQWATSKDMDAAFGLKTGGATRSSTWANPKYVAAFAPGYVEAVSKQLEHTRPTMVFRQGWSEVVLVIVDAIHSIYGGEDPAAAVATLQTVAPEVMR